MAGERITIDIGILQGIFGDMTRLQQQLVGVSGGALRMEAVASRAFGGLQGSISATNTAVSGIGTTGAQAFASVASGAQHVQAAVGGAGTAAGDALGQMREGAQAAQVAVGGLEAGVDAAMRSMVSDIMAPIGKTQELEAKLMRLGAEVRTSRSVKEIMVLKKEIAATQRELDGVNPGAMERKVGGAAARMRGWFSGLAAPIAGAFAVGGITAFATDIAKAAGAQQQFDSSLTNMLQSKEKADALGAQVKAFAASTPFELPEVQNATRQMLAFGFGAEEAIPTLRRLGDVAAGLGQPVGDLAQLYGTARVQGRLYTNDLMQFANRGVPIIGELAKVLGVNEGKVKALVEEGKVGFPQLEQVFANLTAEGSKFGGLMGAQSKTIAGQLSNLSDAWGQFKTDLGLAMAPLITDLISGMRSGIGYLRDGFAWVQENGDAIVGVLKGVAVAVGIYTAALALNSAATLYNTILTKGAVVALGLEVVWNNLVAAAKNVATAATWAFSAALWANPITWVVASLAGLVAVVVVLWNNFEGFRGFLYGLWESIKVVFGGIWAVIKDAFGNAWDIVAGFGKMIAGIFTLDWDTFKEGIKQGVSGVVDSLTAGPRALMGAYNNAHKVGAAYSSGFQEGVADFRADKLKEAGSAKASTPSELAAAARKAAIEGGAAQQDVGAAGLVGGTKGAEKDKSGVSVGEAGSSRIITMNIEMKNAFALPRDANMGAREVAERVVAQLVNKLNDAQFAMG